MPKAVKTIEVSVDFAGAYGRGVLAGVMRYANVFGGWEFLMPPMYALSALRAGRPARRRTGRDERAGPDSAAGREPDGRIVMVHTEADAERLAGEGRPVVNVARTLPAGRVAAIGLPTVLPDDEAVGRLAYRYLRDRGFRAFGFAGHPTVCWSEARGRGFVDAAAADGHPCPASLAIDTVSADWLAALPRPAAVLAANDRYAWAALDAAHHAGVNVPESVALLGVDDDPLLTAMAVPTLSSVALGTERIGYEAAALLARMLDGEPMASLAAAPVEMPPEGVSTRGSTDVLAMPDPAVADACRFIRRRATDGRVPAIGVADVLREVPVGRRSLERRFRHALGRSPLDEIRRVRMERAMALLRDTDLDMPRVAHACGFGSAVRFSIVFRELAGVPPTEYRRRHKVT